MITRNELIQKRLAFWKTYFLEQTSHELNQTLGLSKCLSYALEANDHVNDGSGLYHASLLCEKRLQDFTQVDLVDFTNQVFDHILKDIESIPETDS